MLLPIVNVASPINWGFNPNRTLVGWWRNLPNGQWGRGTLWRDLTARHNDGTFTNSPTWKGKQGMPRGDGSVNFGGYPAYVSCAGGGGLDNQQSYSIAMWVRWNGTQPASPYGPNACVTCRQKNGNWSNNIIGLSTTNPATGTIQFTPATHNTSVTASTAVGDGVWRHVCCTFVSGSQVMYLDGVQDGTGSLGGSISSDTSISFGIGAWYGDGGTYSKSDIDDVRTFNAVLSATDVRAIYQGSKRIFDPALNWIDVRTNVTIPATSSKFRRTLFGKAGSRGAA